MQFYGSLIFSHAIRERNQYRRYPNSRLALESVMLMCDTMQREQVFNRYFNVGSCELLHDTWCGIKKGTYQH